MTSTSVLTAMERVCRAAVRTPMLSSAAFDSLVGRTVWIKDETKQHTGSFKFRGAYYALATATSDQRAAGFITGSSGNHAQALALAALRHDTTATVVIPSDAPASKCVALDALGAQIITYDRHRDHRDALVQKIAHHTGRSVIPSSNHHGVIAGAGTVVWEMTQEVPDLVALFVPIGGGGLAAGSVLAALGHNPQLRVIGVEPAIANDTHRSLRAGRLTRIPPSDTIADGLRHSEPARLPFEIIKPLIHDVVTVPEAAIADAMAYLWRHYSTTAEPSGAVALAGLLQAAGRLPDGPVGVVASGGNVDWPNYRALLDAAIERDRFGTFVGRRGGPVDPRRTVRRRPAPTPRSRPVASQPST
ncbi:threonine/serine dehydratase [Streptomyces sp. NPDC091215]|uniref:threonine ammonia-lyase n=1 Tax=Streptomyces sp. NPDC091215 TaxID=3155192 RepID=UPI003428D189